jgi:hypothetical protein
LRFHVSNRLTNLYRDDTQILKTALIVADQLIECPSSIARSQKRLVKALHSTSHAAQERLHFLRLFIPAPSDRRDHLAGGLGWLACLIDLQPLEQW